MKIAIASKAKSDDSEISEMAGRAPYYLIFDASGRLIETLKNPFSIGGGGAGWGVAKMLANKGVDIVVAGRFGDNMIQALREKGISHRKASGPLKNALKSFVESYNSGK